MSSTHLYWNVIEKERFKSRVRQVFEQVADMLKNTLGPYGATTIIEKFGEMHITKDGWNILKKIHFEDGTDNNIMQLLINISAQVVIKVGDGSTSSIVAANQILKSIESDNELSKVRPVELIKTIHRCVVAIAAAVVAEATKIDPDVDPSLNDIYKLAMIATNGDETISSVIQKIYVETHNASIEFVKSKTHLTHYEVVEGYQGDVTYLDQIYANNDDGTCSIDNPVILMFDHAVEKEIQYDLIVMKVNELASQSEGNAYANRRVVVIAPNYDKFALQNIAAIGNMEYRARGKTTTVYAKVSMPNNLANEQFNDFAIMTGGTIIREAHIEGLLKGESNIDEFVGTVEKITLGGAGTKALIRGFVNRNENMYNICLRDAKAKFKKVEETHAEMNIVNSELYDLKKRLSKLSGRMGVIYVGGASGLEKTANFDMVEDAVKACESAYNYGYNIGGNLIIPIVIGKILDNKDVEMDDTTERVYVLLDNAFRNTFAKVLENKYQNDEDSAQIPLIIDKAITDQTCYNLITDTYSKDIINPSHTDVEILKAAASIVGLLVSSNQYVSIKTEERE